MRRRFLQSLTALGLVVPAIVKSQTIVVEDSRLIGTWRSDREMTMKYRKFDDSVSPQTREKFADLFGKLTWRVTPSEIYFTNDAMQYSERYRVVDKDDKSVVISLEGSASTHLQYIQFEGDYIIVVTGHNVEYFKRVDA